MNSVKRSWGLRRYLVAGVLVWMPIVATVWVLSFVVRLMDRSLLLLPEWLRPEALLGFRIPGLGILFALVIVFLTGIVLANFLGRRLVAYGEDMLKRIPLVRSIYSGVKGFTETMVSKDRSSFRKVVIVEYPRKGMWSIGFVTADDVPEVSAKTGERQVCVYVPTTPNPTSGLLVLVPREQVVEIEMSVDAAMKMIITLGVVTPVQAPTQGPGNELRGKAPIDGAAA